MRKIIALGLLMIASGCSYQNKPVQLDPIPVVVDRLQMQDLSTVPLRKDLGDGEFSTTNSDYLDVAKVSSPVLRNSFGDVQATSVEVKDNRAYVAYNTAGDEVGGAIDIIDVSSPSAPKILSTYISEQYEFSNLVVKNKYLYASGYQKNVGAILMVLSIEGDKLTVSDIKKLNGIYATDLSIYGNKLFVITGTTGGLTEFDISLDGLLVEASFTEIENGLSISGNSYFDFYINGNTDTSITSKTKTDFLNLFGNEISTKPSYSKKIANTSSDAPTRLKLKNAMIYSLNSKTKKLELIDASQSGKTGLTSALNTVSSITVEGTANGFDVDQQKVFLALGEEGVSLVDIQSVISPELKGKLLFKNDNGSSNNIWSKQNLNGQKYVFIAYGRQGLRILSQKENIGTDKNVLVYAKGDSYLGENAKFQLKVNGSVVKTQEVTEDYAPYLYVHSSPLSSRDVVEVVFVNDNSMRNPNLKRNLFVNYMWVSDKYCYQDKIITKNTVNDFGFFETGDSLVYDRGLCETRQLNSPTCTSGFHIEENVCVSNSRSCVVSNGIGSQTWQSLTGWSLCEATSCNSSFSLSNGVCVAQTCSPNSNVSCVVPNGLGSQICSNDGLSLSTCSLSSCNENFIDVNRSCVPKVCNANEVVSCSSGNGTGTKTCNSTGSSFGTCQLNSCSSGFVLNSGECVPQLCAPNTKHSCTVANGTGERTCASSGNSWSSCDVLTCNSGFDKKFTPSNLEVWSYCAKENQSCSVNTLGVKVKYGKNGVYSSEQTFDNSISCNNQTFGDPLVGTEKECLIKGSFSCEQRICPAGQYDNGTTCIPQVCTPNTTTACSVNNFNGSKLCDTQGSAYGLCISSGTCQLGFSLVNGSCVAQICNPSSTRSCTGNDGTGIETCATDGMSYGSCQVNSCNSGFYLLNGSCLPQTCTPASSRSCETATHFVGNQVCSSNGAFWNSCDSTGACVSGYSLSNGTCVAQVCTPNATASCPVSNGTSSKTCSANGLTWGSCSPTVCNSGYSLVNGSCVAQVCTPNASNPCSANNGTGTQTCSSDGMTIGVCQVNSCNSGYSLVNGSCVIQNCTPNSTRTCTTATNFSGSQNCTSNGLDWGSCTSSGSCASGYSLSNGSCVAQVCTPNATASCPVSNGVGTKTCSSTGLDWGSCQISSCNSNFVLENGSCVAQVCTPNSTASCSSGNGTGTKTCNASGTTYGSCQITTCNSGYQMVNGSCQQIVSCSVPNGTGQSTPVSNSSEFSVSHRLINDWLSGYQYELRVDNTSSTNNLTDWSVCFDYSYPVGNARIWNADISPSSTSTTWKLTPKSYNTVIYPGSNNTIGWNSAPGNVGSDRLTNVKLFNSSSAQCSDTPIWTSSGSTCQATSCNSGYFLSNGSCVAQVCSPNSTTTCSGSFGTGTKTCDSTGSSYGSCQLTTCDDGYQLNAGSCYPKQGLLCKVYDLESMTSKPSAVVQNISNTYYVGSFMATKIDIVQQSSYSPVLKLPTNLQNLGDWFQIVCEGKFTSTSNQTVKFSLDANNGANFYLDGTKVVDNDKFNASNTVSSKSILLTPKTYSIKVEYIKGPHGSLVFELKLFDGALWNYMNFTDSYSLN